MILGIDTSNYTTSVAVVSKEQQLLFDERKILDVAKGERGLQQSNAVFQHLQNLPHLIEEALDSYGDMITQICYSQKPRPLEESYMPVFKVGSGFAKTTAKALGVPLLASTHQEGHRAAGLWSAGFEPEPEKTFLTVHISGGTTDLLQVKPVGTGFSIKLLGHSTDLHAGQFVDRIGVKLGMQFPCGPALEELAKKKSGEGIGLPSSVDGYNISFSGPCSAAQRFLDSDEEKSKIAYAVFRCIANSLEKILTKAIKETEIKDILFVGGVAANSFIKERLKYRLEHRAVGARLFFAEPAYSRDNAVGTAVINYLLNE